MILLLSPRNADRAGRDPAYLRQLVDEEYSKRSEATILAELNGSQTSTSNTGQSATVESDDGNKTLFIWTPKCVNLLLTLYEENIENFDTGFQRHQKIWTAIASSMKIRGYEVTWAQCQSKLNGLKRTHKKILDHNNISGNDRKSWPHFERIHEIFSSTGWVHPKAVATEDGPDEPFTSACNDQSQSSQMTKKQKTVKDIEVIFSDLQDQRKAAHEERERKREKRHKEKKEKIEEMMARKERQHTERMEMMKLWLQAITPQNK